ncbi:MAG: ubiquinol oxidase subunit II, partial [Desulfobacterales bacterium]|nr:ubiquinol oxidase subunit II [Desulfobacterales bacterium]
VLGGGGLFAAFPLSYAILMPAFYIPIILMLLGLILRGVSFEFRFKAQKRSKKRWGYVFYFGSLIATVTQGMILGYFVQGIAVSGRNFSGGPFDWLNAFSVMTGVALVAGYALLGAAWLIMKTEDVTQEWARRCTGYLFWLVAFFMGLVSLCMPIIDPRIRELWFSLPNFFYLGIMPVSSMIMLGILWYDLRHRNEYRPFFLIQGIFLMNYIGIVVSTWPWLVPYSVTFRQAAAVAESQSLLLVGAVIMLPVILAYTGYCYWVFRGKSSHETAY